MTPLLASLTPREEAVLLLRAEGLGIREVAHRLGITDNAARKHRDNAVRKSGRGSEVAAVAELIRLRAAA